MPQCIGCDKQYKYTHRVCKAGVCVSCLVHFKNISLHRCPIPKVLTLDLVQSWVTIQQRECLSLSCVACGTTHFLNTNIHGFRMYKTVRLCWDCYNIPQIANEVQHMRLRLLRHDAAVGKWQCALCLCPLFDPVTLQLVRAFERDHVDVFSKEATVWELLVTGASVTRVFAENQNCRNLCVRCHSAVTCAERTVGILGLKALARREEGLSNYIKQRALHQVETLTLMLLG
jgi:hypothetical protein